MYKRFTLDELKKINTWFFDHLKALYTKHQHAYFKGFLKETMKEGKRVYFFQSNKPYFRIQEQAGGIYRFVDEQEKIEVLANEDDVNAMHNLFKNSWELKAIKQENKTILDGLIHEYQAWQRNLIEDKPFVVYDIETTFDGPLLTNQHFEMAYSIASDERNTEKMQYKYIDRINMKRYCDYLLNYDWRIIWYNQIWFDNPVLCMNVWYGKEEIDILNKKSIDPFLFLRKTLWRRISLNNVAKALISSWKTLTSWKEWEELLQEYKKTGDEKTLRKVKKYCRNDVHITLWVFLALLKHKKIHVEWKMYEFWLEDILLKWGYQNAVNEEIQTLL